MPLLTIGNVAFYYRLEGPEQAPVLVLSHSLGQDHTMWDPQAADFSRDFRVLRYDTRGHGASSVTAGDYSIELLGRDVLTLADGLGIERFAFCGLSLGGMIGQWLCIHAPQRVSAAVLANTSPRADTAGMETRRQAVLAGGMASVAETVMGRFFSQRRLAEHPPVVSNSRRVLLATNAAGYAACCAAIRDMDQSAAVRAIRTPVLVVSGDGDVSLPWKGHGEVLAAAIDGARAIHLPTAHLSNLEAPRAFTAAVQQFLLPDRSDSPEAAMRIRRSVLGDAHVDRAVAGAARTGAAFQQFLTRCAWGAVWTRPGLDVRTRRLLVLAITASLGRWDEFRLHVRTGLQHELEWPDLEEALLQTAVYAGVPAANTGFHAAAEERDALLK